MKTIIRFLTLASAVALLWQQPIVAQDAGDELLSTGQIHLIARGHVCDEPEDWGGACQQPCYQACCRKPRFSLFGELLYLRARDADVAYGVAIDGPIVPPPTSFPVQIGRVGVVDQDYDAGFRVGGSYYLDDCSSVTGQFTRFYTSTSDQIETDAPNVIRSLVSHPGTQTAFQDFLSASANYALDMDLVDLDYRHSFLRDKRANMSYLAGLRYASLDQSFQSVFTTLGSEQVQTDVDFEGLGFRFGLEGEYFVRERLMVYAKGTGSLAAGSFRARYFQGQTFDPTVVDTRWKAGRIVPIFDLELGTGWVSRSGRLRISGGYIYSAWDNMVKTDQWIDSVRNNNFADLSDLGGESITFDGFVSRVEVRF